MSEQKVVFANGEYTAIDEYLDKRNTKRIFLVCDNSLQYLKLNEYFHNLTKSKGYEVVYFDDFVPNPLYDSVVKGVQLFHETACDLIIAVGGGSVMDVAKCIKLYSNMDSSQNYLIQKIVPNEIEFMAIPTTAGTGSEATRYAVIYYNGEKQSISDYSCIPSMVIMDASVLKTLPLYQKKSTMLDALCHSIESYWSVNSTDESKRYATEAINIVISNKDSYLLNEDEGNASMQRAANLAGKAINITQTTAGHAMCYKLTSLYGIAHGHAAALCLTGLWPYMLQNVDKCIDPRGEVYLKQVLTEIAKAMECDNESRAVQKFIDLYESLQLPSPHAEENEYTLLCDSVNPVRLRNYPILLDRDTISSLYHVILH